MRWLPEVVAALWPTPQGCTVEWEGQKGKNWTFSVVDKGGLSLVRLSTPEQGLAEAWVRVRCRRTSFHCLITTNTP